MSAHEDPFTAPAPVEVPLEQAPLVRVIAQVRFPEILAVERRDFVAPFQEAIRSIYPILRQEQVHGVMITQDGTTPAKPNIAWRFTDLEMTWRVSITPGFIALETWRYSNRDEFFDRLASVVRALDDHVKPQFVDRIGLRYVNRVSGPPVRDIAGLVRPEIRGVLGSAIDGHISYSLTETLIKRTDSLLLARWGRLPPNTTVDPAAMEPIETESWILDLDMFREQRTRFSPESIIAHSRQHSQEIYAFFRWAVTADFLRTHGANNVEPTP